MSSFGRRGKMETRDREDLRAGWGEAVLWAVGGILVLSMPRAVGAGEFLAVAFGLGSLPYVGLVLIALLSCFLSLRLWGSGASEPTLRALESRRCGASRARCGKAWRLALRWSVVACLVFQAYALIRASLGGYDQAVAWRIEPESYIELALYLVLAFTWCSLTCHRLIPFELPRSVAPLGDACRCSHLFAALALAGLALGLLPVAIDDCWLALGGGVKVIASLAGGVVGILLAIVVTLGVALASMSRIVVLNCLCITFGSAFISRVAIRVLLFYSVTASHPIDDWWLVPAIMVLTLMSVLLFVAYVRLVVACKGNGFTEEPGGDGLPSWMDAQGLVLTGRERQVVDMSLRGITLANIADELGIALSTAGTYRARAVEKLGCGSWNEAARFLQSGADDSMEAGGDCAGYPHENECDNVALNRSLFVSAGVGAVCSAVSAVVPVAIAACLQVLGSLVFVFGVSKLVLLRQGPNGEQMAWGKDIKAIWLALVGVSGVMAMSFVIQQCTIGGALARLAMYAACLLVAIASAVFWGRRNQRELDWERLHSIKNDERAKSYLEIRGIGGTTLDVLLATCRRESVITIANELCIAPTTVISCRARGYRKLRVHGKEGLLNLLAQELS